MPRACILIVALALAGCAAETGTMEVRSVESRRTVIEAGGRAVEIVPPEAFCILRDSVETGAQAVFVLIGPCEGDEGTPGILTASVSFAPLFRDETDRTEELDRLEEFLASDRGRPLLARSSAPGALGILETYREDDMLILLVEDEGTPVIPIAAPRFWRGFLELNGRMVSISASPLAGQSTEDRAMLSVLRDFAARLRAANSRPELPLPAAG